MGYDDRVQLVELVCETPGCRQAARVHLEHVENLTAGGGWTCPAHRAAVDGPRCAICGGTRRGCAHLEVVAGRPCCPGCTHDRTGATS